jgi:putative transport protein
MLDLLAENPLLLLFTVAGLGFPLGRLQLRGVSLGVAAVLFAGLAVGALDPRLKLPEMVHLLGLVLFVYAVGLSSGPAFVASLKRDGLRWNGLALTVLLLGAGAALAAARLLHLSGGAAAGLFAGALTNTPALAAVLDAVKHGPLRSAALLEAPVVAYSVAYPMGVAAVVLALALARRLWRPDFAAEASALGAQGLGGEELAGVTVRFERAAPVRLAALLGGEGLRVTFGRIRRGTSTLVASPEEQLQPGDLVTVVGSPPELQRAIAALGELAEARIDLDRSELDQRRVFVSRPEAAGRRLEDLGLERLEATVTRVRRGDAELLPFPGLVLELGDRVRVVARATRMAEVTALFGDSYRGVSELDFFTFALGIALGLLLGTLPIPLPGGLHFTLGVAGGPLAAALLLGTIGRVGPLVFSQPYGANLALRQVGLVLFLAGVGTRAGWSFWTTLGGGGGALLFAAGAGLTFAVAVGALFVGHRLLRIPFSILSGMVAGIHTQPAVLGYAQGQAGNDLPAIGYASVYPAATIAKIVLAQALLAWVG